MFARLAGRHEAAFVPFLMLGDPGPDRFLDLVRTLVDAGADALELGIPFSDPVADGPVIQAAATRALERGMTPAACWPLIHACRTEWPELPIGLLVYANLVMHDDPARFFEAARAAGVDSVLIADLPVAEAAQVAAVAEAHGIASVLIAPPNASEETLGRIAALARGYTYVVSREGVTGADAALRHDSSALLGRLRALGAPPALLGFGISGPDAVRRAVAMGAAGAIVGSAIVERIAKGEADFPALLTGLSSFAKDLKAATRRS
ncbi:MAG: tryptophan synthase subunit alpha [Gemmatimonadota bacterium]